MGATAGVGVSGIAGVSAGAGVGATAGVGVARSLEEGAGVMDASGPVGASVAAVQPTGSKQGMSSIRQPSFSITHVQKVVAAEFVVRHWFDISSVSWEQQLVAPVASQ